MSSLLIKITIRQVKNLHDPFLKQTKYKLRKYYSKDFFEFPWFL